MYIIIFLQVFLKYLKLHKRKGNSVKRNIIFITFIALYISAYTHSYTEDGWYEEGDVTFNQRIKIVLENPLPQVHLKAPVIIRAEDLPKRDFDSIEATIVDPTLEPQVATEEEKIRDMGYALGQEKNGHYLVCQLDDIDFDGIWDELFFQVDMPPESRKTVYLYIGTQHGLYPHEVHANIACYGKHLMPFWESKYLGWKLWFPTNVDLHGKRAPMLTASLEYQPNISGYSMPREYGQDILRVGNTLGAGGIFLAEFPDEPDSLSRPRFSFGSAMFDVDQADSGKSLFDRTRYAYQVLVNGPIRAMIKAKIMNWVTGEGEYEAEQIYSALAHKRYSTCRVKFTKFKPKKKRNVRFGAGIKQLPGEDYIHTGPGFVCIAGDTITTSTDKIKRFMGLAMIVPEKYKPVYRATDAFQGNHIFTLPVTRDLSYEYVISGVWEDGRLHTNFGGWKEYIIRIAEEINNPVKMIKATLETRKE